MGRLVGIFASGPPRALTIAVRTYATGNGIAMAIDSSQFRSRGFAILRELLELLTINEMLAGSRGLIPLAEAERTRRPGPRVTPHRRARGTPRFPEWIYLLLVPH